MTKKCIICGADFETKSHGESRKYCFECSPSFNDNKSRAASITAIRHAIKKQLVKYKGGKCEICGYNKCIGALQFHHIDENEKDFEIAALYNRGHYDIEPIYKEIDKCQLLCANCHAEKHFRDN
jgi:hypothetical protein